MGCIGMGRDDFERCTPSEFSKIHEHWAGRENRLSREGWEQTRILVSFILPIDNYLCKTKKSAKQLLPFPWDNENENAAPKGGSSVERMKEIVARLNGE